MSGSILYKLPSLRLISHWLVRFVDEPRVINQTSHVLHLTILTEHIIHFGSFHILHCLNKSIGIRRIGNGSLCSFQCDSEGISTVKVCVVAIGHVEIQPPNGFLISTHHSSHFLLLLLNLRHGSLDCFHRLIIVWLADVLHQPIAHLIGQGTEVCPQLIAIVTQVHLGTIELVACNRQFVVLGQLTQFHVNNQVDVILRQCLCIESHIVVSIGIVGIGPIERVAANAETVEFIRLRPHVCFATDNLVNINLQLTVNVEFEVHLLLVHIAIDRCEIVPVIGKVRFLGTLHRPLHHIFLHIVVVIVIPRTIVVAMHLTTIAHLIRARPCGTSTTTLIVAIEERSPIVANRLLVGHRGIHPKADAQGLSVLGINRNPCISRNLQKVHTTGRSSAIRHVLIISAKMSILRLHQRTISMLDTAEISHSLCTLEIEHVNWTGK